MRIYKLVACGLNPQTSEAENLNLLLQRRVVGRLELPSVLHRIETAGKESQTDHKGHSSK